MSDEAVQHVKRLMASLLERRLHAHGLTTGALRDDLDLRDEGLIDSLGFMQLIGDLETQLGGRIDLADLAAESLTNVGALARHIAERHSAW